MLPFGNRDLEQSGPRMERKEADMGKCKRP